MNEWTFSDRPQAPGWYATLHSWDANEATFPDAHYWDGKVWDKKLPFTAHSSQVFVFKQNALDWAYDNDPEGSRKL